MKNFILISALSLSSLLAFSAELTLSGEASLESRYFFNEGSFGNTDQSQSSIVFEPQVRYSWENDRKVINFTPYMRLDDPDEERNHADIRELSFTGAYGDLELKAGISKVFWGVTESIHLVDVINQIDYVDNIDGEDRLGQPMLNLNYQTRLGNFSAFVLPYFREQTFPGKKGRYRGAYVVDTDTVEYTHKDGQNHIDYALRWSHYYGDLEWGVSYFRGTNRNPFFKVLPTGKLAPIYTQMQQYSIDAQYIVGDWLLKTEVLTRDSEREKRYLSTVTGFEYTFSNIKQTGLDIGVLTEWVYDERELQSQLGFYHHTFFGTRIALNDAKSTEFLAGGFINNQTADLASFRVEGSRRINENWKWELEANLVSSPKKNSQLASFKNDDYLQFKISFFW
ncbi:hypothetical protein [Bacteriovorax sp. DB6_IX]|uniref:hypothetical protein n=1 Tax=Bacteriovorax sp. DB6_IX TaxID=1353530 RepID=UPI000389DC5A|nr:hypothetical protein [Bacteriovorax sp. DB6_IX]EQC52137.1 hypothetical protein M901_2879 [Bacteriovorax sp. DB6_IX]